MYGGSDNTANNFASGYGKDTATGTNSETYSEGNTGADNTAAAIYGGSKGDAFGIADGDSATSAGTNVKSDSGLIDRWTIKKSSGNSHNSAVASGNAG